MSFPETPEYRKGSEFRFWVIDEEGHTRFADWKVREVQEDPPGVVAEFEGGIFVDTNYHIHQRYEGTTRKFTIDELSQTIPLKPPPFLARRNAW